MNEQDPKMKENIQWMYKNSFSEMVDMIYKFEVFQILEYTNNRNNLVQCF